MSLISNGPDSIFINQLSIIYGLIVLALYIQF
jgi:hypothetical protein